ncbi:MAG: HEAT repeat domain-containing protein [Nitriliruptoraceae bacterium]
MKRQRGLLDAFLGVAYEDAGSADEADSPADTPTPTNAAESGAQIDGADPAPTEPIEPPPPPASAATQPSGTARTPHEQHGDEGTSSATGVNVPRIGMFGGLLGYVDDTDDADDTVAAGDEPPAASDDTDPDWLDQQLASVEAEHRRRALRQLAGAALDARAAAVVSRALVDPDRSVRMLALEALERVPDRIDAQRLRDAVTDDDPSISIRALAITGNRSMDDALGIVTHGIAATTDTAVIDSGVAAIAAQVRSRGLDDAGIDLVLATLGSCAVAPSASVLAELARALPVGAVEGRTSAADDRVRRGAEALAVMTPHAGPRAVEELFPSPAPPRMAAPAPAAQRAPSGSVTLPPPPAPTGGVSSPEAVFPPPAPDGGSAAGAPISDVGRPADPSPKDGRAVREAAADTTAESARDAPSDATADDAQSADAPTADASPADARAEDSERSGPPADHVASSIPLRKVGIIGGLLGLLEDEADEEAPTPFRAPPAPVVGMEDGPSPADLDSERSGDGDDDGAPDIGPAPSRTTVHPLAARTAANTAAAVRSVATAAAGQPAGTLTTPAPGNMPPPPVAAAATLPPPPAAAPSVLPPPPGAAPAAPAPAPVAGPVGPPPASPDVLEALREDLGSFDVGRRRRALRALLGQQLDAATATVVSDGLLDPDVEIRLLTIEVLERAPHLVDLDVLQQVTLDRDPIVRTRGIELAGRSGDARVVERFVPHLLEEDDEDVLLAGLSAFASLARATDLAESHLDELCVLAGSVAERIRPAARRSLRAFARTLPLGDVVHRLGSEDDRIRAGAAALAYEADDDAATRAVARLVSDTDPRVQRWASAAVARTRGRPEPELGPAVELADEPDVAEQAPSRRKFDRRESAVLPGLVEALGDPKPEIREQSRKTLQRLRREEVERWITAQAETADAATLTRLIAATDALDLDTAAQPIAVAALRVLDEQSPAALLDAIHAYRHIHDVLNRWSASPSPRDRMAGMRLAVLTSNATSTPLLDGLRDPNANVRVVAAELAGRVGVTDRVGAELAERVRVDGSPRVKVAALAALDHAPQVHQIAAAQHGLADADRTVRLAVLDLLGHASDERDFELLARALRDDDREISQRAAVLLARHHAGEALALLWSQIRDNTGGIRHVIIDVLREVDAASLRRLATQALESEEPAARIAAIATLSHLEGDDEFPRLAAALEDPDSRVRIEALHALESYAGMYAIERFLAKLKDPSEDVRAVAVTVIGAMDDDTAWPHLVAAFDDPSESVRRALVATLRSCRSPVLIDLLVRELARPLHREVAAHLLARMGDTATDRLFDRLEAADDELRQVIVDELRAAGHAARLRDDLASPVASIRRRAVAVLRHIGDSETLEDVAECLHDPDPDVRVLAAEMLGDFPDPRAIEALRDAFGADPDMNVVAAIERSYRKLVGDE